MSLQITTGPTAEPVALADVKARLRLVDTADDALITKQIPVARAFAERVTRRSLALKTYAAFLDRFPVPNGPIRVPVPPLIAVSAIKYLDSTLTQQVWDSSEYYIATQQTPGLIVPKPGFIYPSPGVVPGAVEIDFTAGYTVASDDGGFATTDQYFSTAFESICRLCVYLYQNPDVTLSEGMKEDPLGAMSMLRSIKVYEF